MKTIESRMIGSILENLKHQLFRWSESLSLQEIKTNPELLRAVERLELTFADHDVSFHY